MTVLTLPLGASPTRRTTRQPSGRARRHPAGGSRCSRRCSSSASCVLSTLVMIWAERRVVGPHAAARRPQPGRPVRAAAGPGRRHQARAEGGHHPHGGRHVRSSSSRRSSRRRCASSRLRSSRSARACRCSGTTTPLQLTDFLDRDAARARDRRRRRLRHRARRLELGLDVPPDGRPALDRPDDLLRDRDGPVARGGVPLRRLDVDLRIVAAQQSRAGSLILALFSFFVYVISMVGETNRAPFDLPRPRASSSAASTPSTAR